MSLVAYSNSAFADSIDFSKCAQNPDHHCLAYLPQMNAVPPATKPNWHVEIHLPQNSGQVLDKIISDDNFTALKNNIAVMAVVNIFTTTASTTSNYCPMAINILTNQGVPEYLAHFYNKTKGLDMTSLIYPIYCHIETGANPINGDNSNSNPVSNGLQILLNKQSYKIGDAINISGTTTSSSDVSIMVVSPIGNIVTISQVTPINGVFFKSIVTGGTLWSVNGVYTVKVHQDQTNISQIFSLDSSSIPEFGNVSYAILAISIISVIIFTRHWKYKL